ncbi:MAG: aminotransferase class V-fold PLP-dependent enzyme [Nitrososphaeria archaeon]|nr:aminotransferase class V-fold PLP-dependent enzyme [Nitrososphaeria archaeon]NIQ34076.1 aminotransferase class V-fold PLP-dependent enzyme [Nitrososphaeria archaeon]
MGIYEELGVRRAINALGNWTMVGGSIIDPEVLEATAEAASCFVDMEELHKRAGEIIAEIAGAEAAYVTSGAAAGLTLAAAACMTGKDIKKMEQLPNSEGMKNEVIIQKGQRTRYDHNILVSGAKYVEVGSASKTHPHEIEDAINEKTAAIAYFIQQAARKGGSVPLEEVIKIAKRHSVPVIVDAAAELPPVENLRKFIEMGADLVSFSGGKAIGASNATGILCGKKDLIEAASLQGYIGAEVRDLRTIGRPMKVGRESIVGLIIAIRRYLAKDHKAEFEAWDEKVRYMVKELNKLPHTKAERVMGNAYTEAVPHVHLTLDMKALYTTLDDVVNKLSKGNPPIFLRSHGDKVIINPRCLGKGEAQVIVEVFKKLISERK